MDGFLARDQRLVVARAAVPAARAGVGEEVFGAIGQRERRCEVRAVERRLVEVEQPGGDARVVFQKAGAGGAPVLPTALQPAVARHRRGHEVRRALGGRNVARLGERAPAEREG